MADLTRLAATIAGTQLAAISLVDATHERFQSTYGFDGIGSLEKGDSLAYHALESDEIFELHDAREDARFALASLVVQSPNVRFYAAAPLRNRAGDPIGVLSVMDSELGWLSGEQREQLTLLARSIADFLQVPSDLSSQDKNQLTILSAAVEDAADMVIVTDGTVPPAGWPKIMAVNKEFARQMGYTEKEVLGKTTSIFFGEQTDPATLESISAAIAQKEASTQVFTAYRKDGSSFLIETRSRAVVSPDGSYTNRVILARDVTDEHAAEAELQTLRALIDEATDFIFTTDNADPSTGGPFFTYINQSMLRATGYTSEDVIGKSPAMFYGAKTDRQIIKNLIEHIERGEPVGYELNIYRKDGSALWAEFNGRPVLDERSQKPTHWVVVGRDVTRRRETQQQLAVLSTAIEAAHDCIVVYETDPALPNGLRVVFVNDATIRQSGFTREELMHGPTGSGPETDRFDVEEFRDALRRGEPARARLRLYRKDGTGYWGEIGAQPIKNAEGRVTHIVSIERDVTDMVMREQQLQNDNETLSALMQISRELFGVLSSEALRTTFLQGLESLTGIKPTEHVGILATADPFLQRAASSRVPVVDRDRRRAAFAIAASASAPPSVIEINAAAKGGKLDRYVVLALQLLVQNYRTAAQNTALYEEIEDRRAAVIELNQTKSDLISMLAHDFRGPLTSIIGYSELLRAQNLSPPEQERFVETIISVAERLSSLANDTLSMSNLEENELKLLIEPVDYVSLARKSADMFHDHDGVVVLHADPARIGGRADRARLRQVFDNLIGNAVKYSGEKGEVTVDVRKDGEHVIVRVSDNGIGIPEAELERVFTRFSRASNARGSGIAGTGFGLYLCKQIIERHGGTIEVESTVGKGSTFIVSLPLVCGPSHRDRLRILVGDHAGNMRSFMAHTLRSSGYAVKVFDAWEDLEPELSLAAYDLAVIEVETFRANMQTVQRFLDAANAASVPVILIGAWHVEQLEGCAATLGKPYLAADLLSTVERFNVLAKIEPVPKAGHTIEIKL